MHVSYSTCASVIHRIESFTAEKHFKDRTDLSECALLCVELCRVLDLICGVCYSENVYVCGDGVIHKSKQFYGIVYSECGVG